MTPYEALTQAAEVCQAERERATLCIGHLYETAAVPMPQCPYCGSVPHQYVGQCPNVLKVEYYPDGSIKSVEKKP
jgi:hypothetical protein